MPSSQNRRSDGLYRRGEFWLDYDRKKDGELRSPYLACFWYDKESGRIRSLSTRTTDVELGKARLDQEYEKKHGAARSVCPTCGQVVAADSELLLLDVLTDYWNEVAAAKDKVGSLRARWKHLLDWIEQEDRADLVYANFGDLQAGAFRTWSAEQPIISPKGKIRMRALSTTEESLNFLKAAMRHAKDQKRVLHYPAFETFQRKDLSQKIVARLSIEQIAQMLIYASEPKKKREALHRFMIASICTIARPDAVFDISTNPSRRQWKPGDHLLRLNPHGRQQTKKRRPDVVVPPLLARWLQDTYDDPKCNGWLVNYGGEPIHDVDSSWDSMLVALKLPMNNEYKSYILRRSMATILRNWHHERGTMVDYRELQEQMGHEKQTMTDVYASRIASSMMTVQIALREVLERLEVLAPGALHRSNTGADQTALVAAA